MLSLRRSSSACRANEQPSGTLLSARSCAPLVNKRNCPLKSEFISTQLSSAQRSAAQRITAQHSSERRDSHGSVPRLKTARCAKECADTLLDLLDIATACHSVRVASSYGSLPRLAPQQNWLFRDSSHSFDSCRVACCTPATITEGVARHTASAPDPDC